MVDIMWKSWIYVVCLGVVLTVLLEVNTVTAQFVRKKHEPSFFIPKGELEMKPREIPIVKYRRGEVDSVSHKEREKPVRKVIPQPQVVQNVAPPVENITDTNQINEISSETKEVPEYQQVYQEYLEDVDKVAKGRKMPKNIGLQNDLAKMDSNARIKIDKEFNANRDVVGDFNNALNY